MTKDEYEKLLMSDYWKGFSYSLIKERNFTCEDCGRVFYNQRNKLQVHHLVYRDINPWSYKPEEMVVLCEECHKKRHNIVSEPESESVNTTLDELPFPNEEPSFTTNVRDEMTNHTGYNHSKERWGNRESNRGFKRPYYHFPERRRRFNWKAILLILVLLLLAYVWMEHDKGKSEPAQTDSIEVAKDDIQTPKKKEKKKSETKQQVNHDDMVVVPDEDGVKEKDEGSESNSEESAERVNEEDDTVYDVVEQMPSYPGGIGALMQYLSSNIQYPVSAAENGKQGRVVCSFIVEKDGSIGNINVIRSVDSSLDNEAIRVVRSMPRWIPGKKNGSKVRVKYTLPITFRLN